MKHDWMSRMKFSSAKLCDDIGALAEVMHKKRASVPNMGQSGFAESGSVAA
ncbi:hypothetical protein [Corticibacter populi]|uniref:hypothetical protein n=1 Tax=Corticibacter populi TaxID=1550736 RepID=UPI0013C2AE2A|nr:hypothetical protein [Corticibacter populi]